MVYSASLDKIGQEKIEEGWIYYMKNGIIKKEPMVDYGSKEFIFNNGQVEYINTCSKKKI